MADVILRLKRMMYKREIPNPTSRLGGGGAGRGGGGGGGGRWREGRASILPSQSSDTIFTRPRRECFLHQSPSCQKGMAVFRNNRLPLY